MPVAIVTDTTHYLPREMVAANKIDLVSLYVNWQDRTDRESDLPDFNAYYEYLRTSPDLPTTSQPSVGDFLAVFEPIVERGDDIVSLQLASGISGTYESALAAKAEIDARGTGSRIEIVDSATACGGLGVVALAAANVANNGGDVDEVLARAHEARAALQIWFVVDTMEFLRRGGRVGAARAWLGSTLKIKPILSFEQEVKPVERVRTAKRAQERMVEYLQSRADDGADGWVIQHIQAPDEVERLLGAGREIFGCDPLFVSEIGPVIGTHAGPGLVGVGGIPKSLIEG